MNGLAPPSPRLHRSALTRLLATLAEPAAPAASMAAGTAPGYMPVNSATSDADRLPTARLAAWLDWTDAIALSTSLGSSAAAGTADVDAAVLDALRGAAADLRAQLAQNLLADPVLAAIGGVAPRPLRRGGGRDGGRPAPIGGSAASPAATAAAAAAGSDFTPLRRSHRAQQRALDNPLAALRHNTREALAAASPALARLAALDGVLERALAERERHLLGQATVLLEQRYHRLRRAAADAASPPPPGSTPAWLTGFCRELQALLHAELDLRLQPIEAMMTALQAQTHRPSSPATRSRGPQ